MIAQTLTSPVPTLASEFLSEEPVAVAVVPEVELTLVEVPSVLEVVVDVAATEVEVLGVSEVLRVGASVFPNLARLFVLDGLPTQ